MNYRAGSQIKEMRKSHKLTQEKFAELTGISTMSLRRYESNDRQPTMEIIARMASALGLTVGEFLWNNPVTNRSYFWTADLENKLKPLGFTLGHDEDDGYLWINYPEGTLEVSEEDLERLNDSVDTYIKFQLEELKKSRIKEFRPTRSASKQTANEHTSSPHVTDEEIETMMQIGEAESRRSKSISIKKG